MTSRRSESSTGFSRYIAIGAGVVVIGLIAYGDKIGAALGILTVIAIALHEWGFQQLLRYSALLVGIGIAVISAAAVLLFTIGFVVEKTGKVVIEK